MSNLNDAAGAVEADGATSPEQVAFNQQAACAICELEGDVGPPGPPGPPGPAGPAGPAGAGGTFTWGNDNIGAAADTRYLSPGRGVTASLMPVIYQVPVPRAGFVRNLVVRHNSAAGNGNNVVYTVLLNGVATALTVTVPTGVVAQAIDIVNSVPVAQGDRLELRASKAIVIASGLIDVQGTVELS
jgi:hypothetical protein